jgi:hypothetical protein
MIQKFDAVLSVLYKYEMHAFGLIGLGVIMCLTGSKDIGFAIVTAGTTIFKNSQGGGNVVQS